MIVPKMFAMEISVFPRSLVLNEKSRIRLDEGADFLHKVLE